MSRLLIVSNRLPVTLRREGRKLRIAPSVGGLATGLAGHHDPANGRWLGWPGEFDRVSADARNEIEAWLAKHGYVPIELRAEEVERYSEG